MLEEALSKASSHSVEFFDIIIESIIRAQSGIHYGHDYHPYIVKNHKLEKFIQANFSLNKKLFNAIQKSNQRFQTPQSKINTPTRSYIITKMNKMQNNLKIPFFSYLIIIFLKINLSEDICSIVLYD